MSGATGGLSAPERIKRGKLSKRKKRKRIGFALDMTPLVDITFLLLTFFMFTTTMAAPQVMEMSIPPEVDVQIEVKENELLTLRLRNDGKLFWNMANDEPKPVEIKDLRKIAETENLRPEIQNKLIILLLLYWGTVKISEATANKFKMAPIVKIDITDLPPPPSDAEEIPPPPAEQIINTGPASRAGTPVPVPETEITADLKEFASMEELGRASSEGGDGVDLGGFAPNIDVNKKVNVDVRESEGDPWEFVAVEKEPYIDLAELQKKIVYPEMARRAGIEGKVIVRVYVGKDGTPVKTLIESR